VAGGNSLITVPVMLYFGIAPRSAIATNMLALTFLSIGGTVPFLRGDALDRARLPLLTLLTLAGSILGALLVFVVPTPAIPLVISLCMLTVAAFWAIHGNRRGLSPTGPASKRFEIAGYIGTFLLGIYGGFFSGGYVTILTVIFAAAFQMPLVRAVATTKAVNIVSSLVATAIFAAHGLVVFRLGLILGATMFVGAMLGARLAKKMNEALLRRIVLVSVVMLAFKTLLYDVLWKHA